MKNIDQSTRAFVDVNVLIQGILLYRMTGMAANAAATVLKIPLPDSCSDNYFISYFLSIAIL